MEENKNNEIINNTDTNNTAASTSGTNLGLDQMSANTPSDRPVSNGTVYLNEQASTDTLREEFGIPTEKDGSANTGHGSMDTYNTYVYGSTTPLTEDKQTASQSGSYNSYVPYQTYDTYDTNENYRTDPNAKTPVYSQDFTKKKKKANRRRGAGVFWTAVLCIILSLFSGFAGAWAYNKYFAPDNTSVIYQSVNPGSTSAISDTSSLADIIDRLKPSVVEVKTEVVTYGSFFGQSIAQGAGSGVVLTTDGYIVTNFHVIKNANSVTVTTTDGKNYPATVIGYDEEHDVAVIKIEESGLTPAVFADSSTLRVGDTAIAIGNPLGTLGGTVTTGIVSALDRQIEVEGQMMTLLQTNAAVSPGNSGGGLFNANGELIGIVNAKSDAEDVEGLGFAIPSNTVKEITADIMENKSTNRVSSGPILGVTVVSINNEQTAAQYNVNRYGIYVVAVSEGYGSAKAGIEAGDYIFSVDGIAVYESDDITEVLSEHEVGDTVEVQVIRKNQVLTFDVELMEYS